ncbi:MAG: cold-shock protein [Shimia sp.]
MTGGENDTARRVVGTIKWFDPAKGYGFVTSEDERRDILLHANVLRNFGQSSVADGVDVTVMAIDTARGVQAIEVLAIAAPVPVAPPPLDDLADLTPERRATLLVEPARVKWFDPGKGFGFANAFGSDDDIFIHIEVLRQSGFADLQPGEAICLQIIDGSRGKIAASVRSWESAVRSLRCGRGRRRPAPPTPPPFV